MGKGQREREKRGCGGGNHSEVQKNKFCRPSKEGKTEGNWGEAKTSNEKQPQFGFSGSKTLSQLGIRRGTERDRALSTVRGRAEQTDATTGVTERGGV